MRYNPSTNQKGYTLIELLVYVAIAGGLLISITYFFGTITEARVKNQTINEVNTQGSAAMEYITRTIRNATAITSPAAGNTASSLTLTVPTAGLSPTIFDLGSSDAVMGFNADGGTTDSGNSDFMSATQFTASASGNISSLNAFIGPVIGSGASDKGQMAIYSGTSSAPTTLLASSGDIALTASSWNSFPITTVPVTSGQTYWLVYNTNGRNAGDNNLRYRTGYSGQTRSISQTYGTWPGTWPGGSTAINNENSMYALISSTGGSGPLQVKEGSAAAIPLISSSVEVSNLTFKNLTRTDTPGIVQISFTVSRVNPSNRNVYDYQKTFISSAEVSW